MDPDAAARERIQGIVDKLRDAAIAEQDYLWAASFEVSPHRVVRAIEACVAEAVAAENEACEALLIAHTKVRNVLGQDICDYCGSKDRQWPEHDPECEQGQLLAAIRARRPA